MILSPKVIGLIRDMLKKRLLELNYFDKNYECVNNGDVGEGAFGKVFKVTLRRDHTTKVPRSPGKELAVKKIKLDFENEYSDERVTHTSKRDVENLIDFIRCCQESILQSKEFVHPNIVKIHDSWIQRDDAESQNISSNLPAKDILTIIEFLKGCAVTSAECDGQQSAVPLEDGNTDSNDQHEVATTEFITGTSADKTEDLLATIVISIILLLREWTVILEDKIAECDSKPSAVTPENGATDSNGQQDDTTAECNSQQRVETLEDGNTQSSGQTVAITPDVRKAFVNLKGLAIYLVMDLYDGDLEDWLGSKEETIAAAEGDTIIKDLISALHYIHSSSYCHSDLKCANILIRESQHSRPIEALIADFGMCELYRPDQKTTTRIGNQSSQPEASPTYMDDMTELGYIICMILKNDKLTLDQQFAVKSALQKGQQEFEEYTNIPADHKYFSVIDKCLLDPGNVSSKSLYEKYVSPLELAAIEAAVNDEEEEDSNDHNIQFWCCHIS